MPDIPIAAQSNLSDLQENAPGVTPAFGGVWTTPRIFVARLRRLPRKICLAMVALAILAIGGLLFSRSFSRSAKLNIVCEHSFRSAEISVLVDGNPIYSGEVSGTAKKRFGFFGSGRVRFSRMVAVPSGRHTVQVRFNAKADGYDQTKTASAVFLENQENSLSISPGRHGLSLMSQDGAEVPTESPLPSSYQRYLSSIVLSILGSGMSAVIGFLVQDFMRSQKGRLAVSVSQVEIKN